MKPEGRLKYKLVCMYLKVRVLFVFESTCFLVFESMSVRDFVSVRLQRVRKSVFTKVY